MKKNRFLAMLLTVAMVLTLLPLSGSARAMDRTGIREVAATEIGASRLDESAAAPNGSEAVPLYDDDELVTVIVELEDAPLMDYFDVSVYSLTEEDLTAGEAVADFLASDDAAAVSNELLEVQNDLVSDIEALELPESVSEEDIEVGSQWTTVVNGMSICVPYGILDDIRSMDGVKRAYVQHTYSLPNPVENSIVEEGKGLFGYSYDMAGIKEAWAEGYTGKGMLVAVLDTGLDIKTNYEGIVTRTHEAFTDDSFMSGDPTDEETGWDLRFDYDSMEAFLAENQLAATTGQSGNLITYDNNVLYKNLKVPYAADYADGDVNVLPADSDHGTHVSGTIAGYCETEEGEVKFSGVAPDAQLMMMKVFSDSASSTQESYIINALEDSLKLGADIINLSLGSDNGYAFDDTIQNSVFARVEAAGIVLMTSAGNSAYSSAENNYGGESLVTNPETSMMSSPAVYKSNLAVASIDNTINVQAYLTWTDEDGSTHKAFFNDPWTVAMKSDFSDKEYPIYLVEGTGTYNDYYNAGFNNGYNGGKDGLALVMRGEISFADKVNNANYFTGTNSRGERYGVLGVIVYDNDPDGTELISMSVADTSLDSAFISGKDGAAIAEALKAGRRVTIRVSDVDEVIDNETAGEMSSYTSWGAGSGLELKPEITAPGGNIWSTVIDPNSYKIADADYVGSYSMMSGTSMAAPHMSGIGALVRMRVNAESFFAGYPSASIGDVVSQLLVSTAVPQIDADGSYYSPRQQGAGLVDAAAALKTPAYITVDGQNVGKLELKDDPEKTGDYPIQFHVTNISNDTVSYDAKVVLMRPDTDAVESVWGSRDVITAQDVVIKTVSIGRVTVPAGETVTVDKSVSLTAEEKAELDNLFENGTYVEGFVILMDAAGSDNPQIGLPLLAFYGDWTKAPIFDTATWLDEVEEGESFWDLETSWSPTIVGSQLIAAGEVIGYYNLGQNIFDANSTEYQGEYLKENITLSPNGDGYLDLMDDFLLYQLRDSRLIVVEAKDAVTGEVYFRDWSVYNSKTIYDYNYGFVLPYSLYGTIPSWDGTDMDGNTLPSGTQCIFTITAYGEGDYGDMIYSELYGREITDFEAFIPGENEPVFNGHAMDMTGDVISFPVVIDTIAPKLQNNAVTFYEEDGRTYMTGTVYDEDGSIASIEVAPYVTRSYKSGYGDPSYQDTGLDRANAFFAECYYDAALKTVTFKADVTEYEHAVESYTGENNYYDFTWTGNVILSCGDYGANDRSYAITVNAAEGLVLSQTSALLHPGDEFELSVNNNTGSDAEIIRTSSNPEVATIDEFGNVVAIAPGQTIITVSNGTDSAICIVAVEEESHEVLDFNLSLDHFWGMKPDDQVVVKVENLAPSNVVIDEISWSFEEDEEYAQEYAAGLITVGKYSSDALSGYLYFNVTSSQELLPAGHGVLTVTINGVSRTMEVNWDDIYTSASDDDIVSALISNNEVIYVSEGESAVLAAKYRQAALHSVGDVVADLTGLKLDGPDFFSVGGGIYAPYTAKLVNEEGYGLPESIHVYTVYSYGYEYEMTEGGYYGYTYNSETGEISIPAPYGADNKIRIVADGVISEGNPAGEMSGFTYKKPDGLYGPFDWTVTEGNGMLEEGQVTENGSSYMDGATYTPSEPGISYITAATKDGTYSMNFAVICEPILADTLTLDTHNVELLTGETAAVGATLSPEPSLEKDKELIWTSFDPEIATVSDDGTITARNEGYVFIKVCSATDRDVMSYVLVHVTKRQYRVDFVADGEIVASIVKDEGSVLTEEDYPAVPEKEGYTGEWKKVTEPINGDLVIKAVYTKISEPENPDNPENPTKPDNPNNPENPNKPENPGELENPAKPENPTMPENPTEPETPATAPEDVPGTGDSTSTSWLFVLAAVAAGVAVVLKKRKNA